MAGATFAGANYMDRLGQWAGTLPGIDIARAHRDTMGISTMTTGMALGLGILGGPVVIYVLYIPMAVFEVTLALWLIFKGAALPRLGRRSQRSAAVIPVGT